MSLIREKLFWEKDTQASIMLLNKNYLTADTAETAIARAAQWPSLIPNLQTVPLKIEQIAMSDQVEPYRILVRDVERTFASQENRLRLFRFLAALQVKFGDYAQSLGYAASFLLLFLDEQTVFSILCHLNYDENYVPGYWKAVATACATDGFVYQHLLQIYVPNVAKVLQKNTISPETFVQKWFAALCLHVLPFEALMSFWEQFLQGGYRFLLKFGLSLAKTLEPQFLAATSHATIYGLLRFDPSVIKGDFTEMALKIIADAAQFDINNIDFKSLRVEMYDKNLKARMERTAAPQNDSDDDDEEDLDDEEEDDGGSCEICKQNMPEYQCSVCNKQVCENCHSKNKGGHQKTHKVKAL